MRGLLMGIICFQVTASARGVSASDFALKLEATVQSSPARITLAWPADAAATGYSVRRKFRDALAWGSGIALPGTATNYTDATVATGMGYEYWVRKNTPSYEGDGYLYTGIEMPLVDSRGKVLLLVEAGQASALALELARLERDLVGDGWTVLRHDVPRGTVDPANPSSSVWSARSNELATVKSLIQTAYLADPTHVKSVFIFGHLPVPYSGVVAPDDHGNHLGAWPADVFYADMFGAWPDTTVSTTFPVDQRNWNVPGDGKFDPFELSTNAVLEVGRVDLANLPALPLSERELLRQYLKKDHNFRHNLMAVQRRGIIDDNLGLSTGEPLAVNGWRNFSAFFGATNIAATDWLTTLDTQSFLWGYGCGPGNYTSVGGVADTSDFVTHDPRTVFTMLFGSYSGDWDSSDNILRAALGTPNYGLTCAWAGRPNLEFHHMALGETIGFGIRTSQSNNSLYDYNVSARGIHVALMGDPTLRMHPVSPPAALIVSTNQSGGVNLRWNASSDAVIGYHVYRAPVSTGPYIRLTGSILTGTNYADPSTGPSVYMVRAVKLETSASGTYFNASQGIFQSLDGSAGLPGIVLLQPTNHAVFLGPTNLQLVASTFDPANSITNIVFLANGAEVGQAGGTAPSALWPNVPGGIYSVKARAQCSTGQSMDSSNLTVRVIGPAPILSASILSNGFALTGEAIPGLGFRIQFVGDLTATNWQTLGSATSNPAGWFQFIDSSSSTQRFYRCVSP